MFIGNGRFDLNDRVYIMGILNLTPDSFFDGGRFNNVTAALKQVERLICEGADIIDIGAESTRPGSRPVSLEEELARLGNVILEVKKRFKITISIDTMKAAVAKFALSQGADLVNDVSCCADVNMARTVAEFDASYCLTYNKKLKGIYDFWDELTLELNCKVQHLLSSGIKKNKIIVDPGIGFNKTFEENLLVLRKISSLLSFGYPVLIGASNKSFIGKVLGQCDVLERAVGTVAVSVFASLLGVNFIRVHEVSANLKAVRVAQVLKRGKLNF